MTAPVDRFDVVVSPGLPAFPSFGEDIRRRVRHGLADVLDWCGQTVGPAPGEPTHVILSVDPASPGRGLMFVSASMRDQLAAASS